MTNDKKGKKVWGGLINPESKVAPVWIQKVLTVLILCAVIYNIVKMLSR